MHLIKEILGKENNMRDLTKYDINDLRNLVTRQEAQIAAYKIQIQELEEKIQEREVKNGETCKDEIQNCRG